MTRLEAGGRTLAGLTEHELRAACREAGVAEPVPDGLLRRALDVEACLAARGDVGGAAPAEVRRQAGEIADALGRHEGWLAAAGRCNAAAAEGLMAEARAFAGGAA